MGRSKRKPTVVRKVLEQEQETDEESDTKPSRRRTEQLKDQSGNDSYLSGDLDLPEGTVVVRPEPVQEKKSERFKGPEFKSSKKVSDDYLAIVTCTACAQQINTGNPGAARRHPVLQVLVCKRCYRYYKSGEFSQDSNGIDEQCRWCGEGGNLLCCDFCSNAFCKGCIKRNLGRSELSRIMDSGDDEQWHCYVCNPRPLSAVLEDCSHVFEVIEKEQKRTAELQKNKEKGKTHAKKPDGSVRVVASKPLELLVDYVKDFSVNSDNLSLVLDDMLSASKNLHSLLRTLKSNVSAAEEVNSRDIDKHSSKRETKDDMMLRIVKTRCVEMFNKGFQKFMKSIDSCKESTGNQKSSRSTDPGPRSPRLSSKKSALSDKFRGLKESVEKRSAKFAEVISVSDSSDDAEDKGSSSKARRKLSYKEKMPKKKRKSSSVRSVSEVDDSSSDLFVSSRDKSSKGHKRKSSASEDKSKKEHKKRSSSISDDEESKGQKISKEHKKASVLESQEDETAETSKRDNDSEEAQKSSLSDNEAQAADSKQIKTSSMEADKENTEGKDKKPVTETDGETMKGGSESPETMDVSETGNEAKADEDKSDLEEGMEVQDGALDSKEQNVDCSMADVDEETAQVSSSKRDSADEQTSDKPGQEKLHVHLTPQKSDQATTSEEKIMSPNSENTLAHLELLKEMADGISDGEDDEDGSDEISEDSDASTPKRRKRSKKKGNKKPEKLSLKKDRKSKSDGHDSGPSEKNSQEGRQKRKGSSKSNQSAEDVSNSDDDDEEDDGKTSSKQKKTRRSSRSTGKLAKEKKSHSPKGRSRKFSHKDTSDEESSDAENDSNLKSNSRKKRSSKDEEISSTKSDSKPKLKKGSKKDMVDNSESDDTDDDFKKATKAIDKLCEMPSEQKRRRSGRNKSQEDDEDSDKEEKKTSKDDKKEKKDKREKSKRKSRSNADSMESSSNSSGGESPESDDEMEKDDDELVEDDPDVSFNPKSTEKVKEEVTTPESENKKAMKSLLAEMAGPLTSDSSDSESSEPTPKTVKKKKKSAITVVEKSTNEDDSSESAVISKDKKLKSEKQKSEKSQTSGSESDSESDSDFVTLKKKTKKRTKNNLLGAKLSDSDSDFVPTRKKVTRTNGKENGRGKKRKAGSSSDLNGSSSLFHDSDISVDTEEEKRKKKRSYQAKVRKRRRIKTQEDSDIQEFSDSGSADSGSGEDQDKTPKGRKKIRRILTKKKLGDETKAAAKAEEDRRKRVSERQKLYNNHVVQEEDVSSPTKCPMTTKLILETKSDSDDVLLEVNKKLVRKLKPHQVEAIQFMYECCCETVSRMRKGPGAGCILAHCMGLGKTLSVIAFVHTMLANERITKMRTCLVVCPLNTVLNWQREWHMWFDKKDRLEVFEMSSLKDNWRRADALRDWQECGGILIIGYEMYRNLTLSNARIKSKKLKKIFEETLVTPGPDLVVCDEGHILKNDTSGLSKAMSKVNTLRRIVLTGTPLQNNLVEYHCMVNFVKPNLLGTRKEFLNRFVNPITNGQCADSTQFDVKLMKRRAHILHDLLAGCVQRRDYSALTKFLPPKFEYVISVRLSKIQIELYRAYLGQKGLMAGDGLTVITKGAKLFSDYQSLMKIWTHPWILKLDEIRTQNKASAYADDSLSDGSLESSFINDDSDDSPSESGSNSIKISSGSDTSHKNKKKRGQKTGSSEESNDEKPRKKGEVVKEWKTRSRGGVDKGAESSSSVKDDPKDKPVSVEWWSEFVTHESEHAVELGGKLVLLLEVLRMCEEIGDKVLVFSQSLLSLDLIENFLQFVDQQSQEAASNKEEQADDKGKEDKDKDKEDDKQEDDKKASKDEENDNKGKKDQNKDKIEDDKQDDKKANKEVKNDKGKKDKDKDKEEDDKQKDKTANKEKDKNNDKGKKDQDKDTKDDDKGNDGNKENNKEAEEEGAKKDEGAGGDDKKTQDGETNGKDPLLSDLSNFFKFGVSWTIGEDYFRMDGSTPPHLRKAYSDHFNDPDNFRARLFLISTKAGSLGTNLVAANRVIVFDASWNPSHDIQSIFRVYRFGQSKPVYVYRFLAQGTMEEKIYERQVTKQSLSQRVIDEHQIERHFNTRDLQELYRFQPDILDDPNRPERPTPVLPKDHLLADLLHHKKSWIVTYHEHDSLLENQISEELSEEERKAAWEEYEQEKKGVINRAPQIPPQFMMQQGQYFNQAHGLPPQMVNQGGYGSVNVRPPNVMAIIHEMRQRYPNLTPEALQMQVQAVVRQQIAQQILQQQELQRRQIEQRQFQEQQRLRQIQAQIQQRQQNLENSQRAGVVYTNSILPKIQPHPPTNDK